MFNRLSIVSRMESTRSGALSPRAHKLGVVKRDRKSGAAASAPPFYDAHCNFDREKRIRVNYK